MLSRTSPTLTLALLVVLALGLTGLANATQTTTLNATTILSEDAGILGRLSIGTTTLDTTGAALHIEGNQTTNGTVNATTFKLGAWNARYTGNLSGTVLSSNRTWTLQDTDGTLALLDAVQSVTGTWAFSTNPTFNANGITWTSVSKSGSSLADLTTRSASDLSSGTLARARADAATAYTDTAQSWSAVQSVPGLDLKVVGSNDASKSFRFDLTGKGANFVGILNDSSTQDRSWFLPDHNGTFVAGNATETISGPWTFTTGPALGDATATTIVATGKVTASDIYAPNGVFNNTLTFGAGSGTTLIDSGKVAASNGFFPNAQVNTTLLVGQASQSKDEALGVTGTASVAGSSSVSVPILRTGTGTTTFTGGTAQTGNVYGTRFMNPTFTAATTAGTAPLGATVEIENQPTCDSSGGALLTCSNAVSLYVPNGKVLLSSTTPTGNARFTIGTSGSGNGASTRDGAISLPTSTDALGSTQTGDIRTMDVGVVTYTNTVTSTATSAASFYVAGAPVCSSGQTCTNTQAFWVAGGLTQLDGNVKIGASGTSIGFFGATVHAKDTLTDSTGGSTGTSCAAIGGSLYSTDAVPIKNCLASLLLVLHDYGLVG